MADFKIQIAGHVAAVHSLFESTPAYFSAYLTEKTPELSITVTREDLEFEQAQLLVEARQEGFRVRVFPDPYLDRASIQRKFAEYLFGFDILLLHGSAVAVDGEGYLFTAKSGTGKSTHTRLWMQEFGHRAVMINDDKPFLRITETGVFACGSPWSGKHGLDTNISVPLRGICLLARGQENRIEKMAPKDALPMLLHQSYRPMDPCQAPRLPELVNALAEAVPLWHMQCTKDIGAAKAAYAAMSQR